MSRYRPRIFCSSCGESFDYEYVSQGGLCDYCEHDRDEDFKFIELSKAALIGTDEEKIYQ